MTSEHEAYDLSPCNVEVELDNLRTIGINGAARFFTALAAENAALRARVEALEKVVRFYADGCDASAATPCGYEGNLCCLTARAALASPGPAQGEGE